MRKLVLFYSIFSLLAVSVEAQNVPQNPKDPKAKAILDKLSQKTKGYTSITAEFEFRLLNKAEGIDDKQDGTIILKDDKYKLKLAEQEIISNGTTVWTYLKDVKEVQISEVDEEEEDEVFLNPKKIFTIYESGFKYVLNDEEVRDGKTCHVIKLYPENPGGKPFHTIILYIDKSKNQMQSMEVKSKDGNTFIYTIKSFVENKSYSSTLFEFKTPEGVEEIDLR
jgi:outer membrane lipoprotein-sorting protein